MKPESQSWNQDQKANFPQVWGLGETKRGLVAFFTQAWHSAFLLSLRLPASSLGVFGNTRSLVVPFVLSLYHLLSCFTPVMSQRQLKGVPLSSTMPSLLPSLTKDYVNDVTHTNCSERSLLRVRKSSAEKLEKATAKVACGASVWPLCAYAHCGSL